MVQDIFSVLLCIQFVLLTFHDLLEIPGWTHRRQVIAALGWNKVIFGMLFQGILSGFPTWLAIEYWGRPAPAAVLDCWVVYCGFVMIGAISAWWIPYFRGTDQKTKDLYAALYAGTWKVLPQRGDNPNPNVLHLIFHTLMLATLTLAVVMRIGIS